MVIKALLIVALILGLFQSQCDQRVGRGGKVTRSVESFI